MSASSSSRPARVLRAAVAGALALAGLVAAPSILTPAHATTVGSTDGGAFSSTTSVAFGKRCPGTTTTASLAVGVDRDNANSTSPVFADNATLTVTLTQAPAAPFSIDKTSGTLTLPGTWSAKNNVRVTTAFTLTYLAPGSVPANQTITFNVSGPAAGGGTASQNASVTLSGDLKPASACDGTPPVITPQLTGALGTNGWYTSDVTLTWQVSDPESGISSSTGCGAYSRTTDTTGVTLTCSATNGAGLTSSVSRTIKRDATAPSVDAATLQAGSDTPVNGLFNAPFTVAWSGSDLTSGLASCDTLSYSGPDTASDALNGGCTDEAGNSAAGPDYTFGYDATGPTITPVLTRNGASLTGADSNGWFNAPFSVDWSADESGVTCPAATSVGGAADETNGKTITVTCTDAAGNTGTGTFTYKYDETAPTVDVTGSSSANGKGWRNAPFTISASGDDSLSGGVTCEDAVSISGPGDETADGAQSLSCTDAAGNSASATFHYKYDETAPTAAIALDRDPVDGWYNSEVTATTTYVTPVGGAETAPVTCTAQQKYSGPDQEGASLSGSCTDDAGNASDPESVVFNYDGTAPTFVLTSRTSRTGTDGSRDWNNGDVLVEWTCTDATSGFDRTTVPVTMARTVSDTISGEGMDQTATGQCTDVAGNTRTLSESGVNIDRTKPLAPTLAATTSPVYDGWFKDTVTVTSVSNGDQGDVRSEVDGTSVSGPRTRSTSGMETLTDTVVDNAGNESDASSIDVKVDADGPRVTLTCPTSDVLLGSTADASWSATDAESGIAGPASGTVPLGTSSVGMTTATLTADSVSDNVGHGHSAKTCGYRVVYPWAGLLQPVNKDGSSRFKLGSTIPVKFALSVAGAPVTNAVATLQVGKSDNVPDPGVDEAVSTSAATTGNLFRYDSTGQQYIFNLSTKTGFTNPDGSQVGWSTGTWYLKIRLDDGTVRLTSFNITK